MGTSDKELKTLVQCDFDGTVTEEDVSFLLLDIYAKPRWRYLFRQYERDRISVGQFNREAFGMVKATKSELIAVVRKNLEGKIKIREGFPEMVEICRRKGFRLVIVSNGLAFYIEEILRVLNVNGIEVNAAKAEFDPRGMEVQYIGPGGNPVENGFKEAFVESFLAQDYRIAYIGNGVSDVLPAKRCQYVFATGSLLNYCRDTNMSCFPFNRFNEVSRVLETL